MKSHAFRVAGLIIAIVAGLVIETSAQAKPMDYTGHYERTDTNSGAAFSLDITQTGIKANVSFSAGREDGSGAAPDGGGEGTVDRKGVLTFKFTDSFNNEGTATLDREKDGYHLEMNVSSVAEPRAMSLYGSLLLKKTSAKPSSTE
jgi:hypothetical protein